MLRVFPCDRPRRGGQLQAVPGGDVADQAAFGGHDRCDTAERQVPGQRADLPGLACPAERREGTGVTGPGHLAGEQLQARAGQQPSRVRPDQVPADHQEQPGSQAAAPGAAGGCPARRGKPPGGDLAASRLPACASAARPPSVPATCRRAARRASPGPARGSAPAAAGRPGCRAGTAGPSAAPVLPPGLLRSPATSRGVPWAGNCRITCAPSGAEGPGQTRVNRDDDVSPAGAAALTRPSRTGPASVSGR